MAGERPFIPVKSFRCHPCADNVNHDIFATAPYRALTRKCKLENSVRLPGNNPCADNINYNIVAIASSDNQRAAKTKLYLITIQLPGTNA